MATFKHISSKNADYSAAEAYLTFKHDEFTMKATRDENGRLIPRKDYRISTLNCGEEYFAGHQTGVCTHPDGHNGSGNIHVHIVINSLRIAEVPFMPYMDRPCDTQPGMKHRCTTAAMEYFRSEVMEMCHAAGLHQIDLRNGSKVRVTEREYWAKKKGQLALDAENASLIEQGLPVKQTKFEMDKDKLREEIRAALMDAVSFEDFAEKLLHRGITVKES